MVKSKFNYLICLNYFLVFALIAGIISLFYFKIVGFDESGKKEIGILAIFFLSLFLFYTTSRWANKVTIDGQTIIVRGLLKKRIINYAEIASINLFSFENFYWSTATGSKTIATRINLGNGDKIVIADPFYKNIGEIKTALDENFKDKIEPLRNPGSKTTSNNTVIESEFERFSGNPYTSFNGIMVFGWTIFILSLPVFIKRPVVPAHLFLLFPTIFLLLGFGYQLNYFLVSNQRVIVKNHFLFWINKKYDIGNIVAADFETPYRRSQALRITTRDFKSKVYCAGSLRDRHWKALRKRLTELHVHFV